MREHFSGPQDYRNGAGWQQTDPGRWPTRSRVNVRVGKTLGERMRQQSTLAQVIGHQQQILATGGDGVLVDLRGVHAAMLDYARAGGIQNPEQYFVDPASEQGKQASQQKAQQAQAQAQQAQAQQQAMLQMQQAIIQLQEQTKLQVAQMRAMGEQAKLAEDRRQHGQDVANELTELELKYNRNVPGAEV